MNKRTIFSLPLIMLAGGLLSVFFGKELSWDLANYHFYNPFAYLYGRNQYDFWPSSFIHQYINPSIDFISYLLITVVSPWSAEFILGAIHAINAWIVFLIAKEFIPQRDQAWIAVLLAVMGMLGPTVLPGIGSFMNDNLISLFVLGFVLLQIKSLRAETQGLRKLANKLQFLSGFLLGIGFGLKLTAGIFLAGAVVSTLILPVSYSQRLRMLVYWGCAAAAGFFIIAGYWMILQWTKYHNPFFPFFNGFFHSNEFAHANWRDTRFLPQGIWQHLFYPFYFSFNGKVLADAYEDCRILFVFILFMITGCLWIWRRVTKRALPVIERERYWLFAFVIFSYFIWQEYFSIERYFVAGEMLAPLVIYLLVQKICRDVWQQFILLTILFCTILFLMTPIKMARMHEYGATFFNVKLPESVNKPQAHVLISYPAYVDDLDPRPQAYLIPFFPRSWHFTGIPFWHGEYLNDAQTTQLIKNRIMNMNESIYLLTPDLSLPEFYRIAASFDLQPDGPCDVITSDRQVMTGQRVLLCPVKR